MAQNTSSAVMQQRREPHDSLDDFPTPPWGTRALVEHVIRPRQLPTASCWEPACNRGYMVRPLNEYFDRVHASDIFDYSMEWPAHHQFNGGGMHRVIDFLWPDSESPHLKANPPQWVITNPPFRLAEQFIVRAMSVATVGCAMLVRSAFLEGAGRYDRLFSVTPPTVDAIFVERLSMFKSRIVAGASTATSYTWLVWIKGRSPEPRAWIPPCRAKLERDTDYPQLG